MPYRSSREPVLRDRRDSNTFHRAAATLRRRAAHCASADDLDATEAEALAGVFDAAGRDPETLSLGLRSELLAAADAILLRAQSDPATWEPKPRNPGSLS